MAAVVLPSIPTKPKKTGGKVNVQKCNYPIVITGAEATGLEAVKSAKYNILWQEQTLEPSVVRALTWSQRTNLFPGMRSSVHKCNLSEMLNFMKELFPEQFKFHPRSWSMPSQWADACAWLDAGAGKRTLIVKPNEGSQGDGILLLKRARDLPAFSSVPAVAQRYVPNPLLLDGVKFDMRLYVLVTSFAPLRAYIHNIGLVRLATEKYEQPDSSNLSKVMQHLTNYSLNKLSTKFETADASDVTFATGHKRVLAPVFAQLTAEGHDMTQAWEDIKKLVANTLIAMHLRLWEQYAYAVPADDFGSRCFHVLGFDVLLDDRCRPYLLEVNNAPSLLCEAPVDDYVKGNVLADVFRIVKPTKRERTETAPVPFDTEVLRKERIAHEDAAILKTQFDAVLPDSDCEDISLFMDEKLLEVYRRASGVRQSGLSSAKFVRLLRTHGITDLDGSTGLKPADADIMFINLCRSLDVKEFKLFEFCQALLAIAKRLYPGVPAATAVATLIQTKFIDGDDSAAAAAAGM